MARIHIRNGVVIQQINIHLHESNPGRLQALAAITAIKRKAAEGDGSTAPIINSQLVGLREESLYTLPSQRALKQAARRVRKKVNPAPPQPTSLIDLVIPEKYASFSPSPGVTNGEIPSV